MKEAFLVMGALYFVFMMFGAFRFRVPAPGGCRKAMFPQQRRRGWSRDAARIRGPGVEDTAVLASVGRCSA